MNELDDDARLGDWAVSRGEVELGRRAPEEQNPVALDEEERPWLPLEEQLHPWRAGRWLMRLGLG